MCITLEKQTGGDTKIATSNHSERMQMFCRDGKFFEHVLSGITEIIKTDI